jgi:hypothetical protein
MALDIEARLTMARQLEAIQANADADADVEVEVEVEVGEEIEIGGCPRGDPTTSQQQRRSYNGEEVLMVWLGWERWFPQRLGMPHVVRHCRFALHSNDQYCPRFRSGGE